MSEPEQLSLKEITARLLKLEKEVASIYELTKKPTRTYIDTKKGDQGAKTRKKDQFPLRMLAPLKAFADQMADPALQGMGPVIMHGTAADTEEFSGTIQASCWPDLQEEDEKSCARLALTLASEHRIKILKHLMTGPKTTRQLAEIVGLEGGPLYHHLRDLQSANLVKQDERSTYAVSDFGFDSLMTILALHRRCTHKKPAFWKEAPEHE